MVPAAVVIASSQTVVEELSAGKFRVFFFFFVLSLPNSTCILVQPESSMLNINIIKYMMKDE